MSIKPHKFETRDPADTWCKHCNTEINEVSGMHVSIKHTALPWRVIKEDRAADNVLAHSIADADWEPIADHITADDAEFITLVCNSHYELLDALQAIASRSEACTCISEHSWYGKPHTSECLVSIAEQAIAKATTK